MGPMDLTAYDLGLSQTIFSGGHYDVEPSGQPVMVTVSGVACGANYTGVPEVTVCVMHNVPASGPSKTGPQYTCTPSGMNMPVPLSVVVDGSELTATDCWFTLEGCKAL